jgi:hypothetical protein
MIKTPYLYHNNLCSEMNWLGDLGIHDEHHFV